jgi:hypothetical protein
MLTVRVSTRYPLASLGAVRPGTIGLQFSTAGAVVFTTGRPGDNGTLVAGDV